LLFHPNFRKARIPESPNFTKDEACIISAKLAAPNNQIIYF
jgi:hypothetical protein